MGDLKVLKDEIQPYFDEVKNIQKTRKEINVEELSSEKVGELLAAVEGALLEESKEQEIRDAYQQILTVLGYEFEMRRLQQTYAKVKNLVTRSMRFGIFLMMCLCQSSILLIVFLQIRLNLT